MDVVYILVVIALDLLFTASFLWLGMKLIQVYTGVGWSGSFCPFWQLVVAAGAAALVAPIPYVGFVLSWVVLLALLIKFTETSFGEVLLMVIVGKIASIIALLYLGLVF